MEAEAPEPFGDVTPAASVTDAQWWADALEPHGIGFRVPRTFEAVVRIHHRLSDGRRWSDAHPDLLRPGRPGETLDVFTIRVEQYGALDREVVDALIPLLRATTSTPDRCHYGLWVGWGGLTIGSAFSLVAVEPPRNRLARRAFHGWRARRHARAVARHQQVAASSSREHAFVRDCAVASGPLGRDVLLMDGPIAAVASIGLPGPAGDGTLHRWAPQRWWPDDRAWFVGADVDDPWTYVAGSEALAREVEKLPLETVRLPWDAAW